MRSSQFTGTTFFLGRSHHDGVQVVGGSMIASPGTAGIGATAALACWRVLKTCPEAFPDAANSLISLDPSCGEMGFLEVSCFAAICASVSRTFSNPHFSLA